MLQLQLKSCTRDFPESVSELTPSQWYDLAESYLLMQSGILSYKAMCVRLVYRFIDMRRSVDTAKVENSQLLENIAHLAGIVENLFEEKQMDGQTIYQIKLDFFDNPLPVITVGEIKFKAPEVLVNESKFGKYVEAVNAYNDYARNNEERSLELLINAWYQSGDKKAKIKANDLDPAQQLLVFINFAAIQNFIVSADALDIGGGIEINIAQLFKPEKGKKSNRTNFGLVGALYNLAKEGTFGNKQETETTDTWEVLIRMAQLHEEGKQQLKDAKNSRIKGSRR